MTEHPVPQSGRPPERGPEPASAEPPRRAQLLAFLAIVVGGVCGGLLGFAFTDLQCDDGCTGLAGLSGLIGAVIGAGGVGIVAVLALRAMGEWRTIRDRDADRTHPSRRLPERDHDSR